MLEDFYDFLRGFLLPFMAALLCLILSLGLLFSPFMWLAYSIHVAKCQRQTVSFAKSEYDFFAGCMVEYEGQMVPLNIIRIEVENKE